MLLFEISSVFSTWVLGYGLVNDAFVTDATGANWRVLYSGWVHVEGAEKWCLWLCRTSGINGT